MAAEQGWLIIARDRRVREGIGELRAVRDHRANADVGGCRDNFSRLEVVMCRWEVVDCADRPRPFVYAASRTTFEAVPPE